MAKKVKLENIKSLTLHKGRQTAGRRVDPVLQCVQVGSDGLSPQWRCEADLPPGMSFGPLEVVCEGWSRPGDPYVLAGSCGLEYELRGKPRLAGTHGVDETDYAGLAIKALWALVAVFFLYRLIAPWFRVRWQRHSSSGLGGPGGPPGGGPGGPGGWGGGPGGGWGPGGYHPPPPYAKDDPSRPAQGLGSRDYGGMFGTGTRPQQGGGWGTPGFWTGLATGAGAAAAYGLATRNGGRQREDERVDYGDYARWRAQRPTTRTWDAYEPSPIGGSDEAGPSRRAAGYGGSRTR